MSSSSFFVGLMSGTSLDGIDAALVDLSGQQPRLLATSLTPFPSALRTTLLALQAPGDDELDRAARAANELADCYSDAVIALLRSSGHTAAQVAAIGMHGQTIRHRPDRAYTLQIGNAAKLAERTGICVVSDFRSRDIAAGGQGAPLVPAFHRGLFGAGNHRAIVNIGGIANITDLAPNGPVRGWDCGPGNLLLDGWIERHQGQPYDADGAWAFTGKVAPALLEQLLGHRFFSLAPPMSTGRDDFHLAWLDRTLADLPPIEAVDVQASLLELTTQGIARSVQAHATGAQEVYVCGGGARNAALMRRLADLLAPRTVSSTEAIGLHPDWVEAVAFAWLAQQCLAGRPGNLPEVTGAEGPRVLGAIYPA
jgi:anhydro-N-acetylmuramic acid kinase